MHKNISIKILLIGSFLIQPVAAKMDLFSRAPVEQIKDAISNYDREKIKNDLHEHYHLNEQSKIDNEKLYKIMHDFRAMKKKAQETQEKTRLGYLCKGASASTVGIISGIPATFVGITMVTNLSAIDGLRGFSILMGLIGSFGTISYAGCSYGKNQLDKMWHFDANAEKIKQIQDDLQIAVKAVKEQAENYADEDMKEALKNFVLEMSASPSQS
ncbi:ammonium transporter [Candidatus Dependentiae bacterium]|nr:ammonium transporter [Candidatus Dependentiae bacterium]